MFDPCKIETLEQIVTNFVVINYVNERNVYSKFSENPSTITGLSENENKLLYGF